MYTYIIHSVKNIFDIHLFTLYVNIDFLFIIFIIYYIHIYFFKFLYIISYKISFAFFVNLLQSISNNNF